jgi:hypothetical protein
MTWDGSQWQTLMNGPGTAGSVLALTTWNGQLIAGGDFLGGNMDRIALWTGSAWQQMGGGFPTAVKVLAVWRGNLVAAGGTGNTPVIQIWNGTSWTALSQPPSVRVVRSMVSFYGSLCIGGSASNQSPSTGQLDRWDGTSWSTMAQASDTIYTLAVRQFSLTLSSMYVGGAFTTINGVNASGVAVTGGTTFSAVGSGMGTCLELNVRPILSGTAIVARSFSTPFVRQLSGSTFVAMGDTHLNSLTFYANGYHGARWFSTDACQRYDGSQWVPVRGPGMVGEVRALAASGNDMILGGTFATISGVTMNRIARWNGTTFQALGSGLLANSIDALLSLDNGDIVAGGQFLSAGGLPPFHIARWNGTTWSVLGQGMSDPVLALCKMPNGDIVAGGSFIVAGGVPCARIARWNGTA